VAPSLEFLYAAPPFVASVSPSFATAGTVLQLFGTAFIPGAAVCRVGRVFGQATFVSSVLALCEAPSQSLASPGQLLPVTYSDISARHNGSATMVGHALAELPSAAEFTFTWPPGFEALRPARGPARGGTPVRLHGHGFANAPGLICRFGGVSVAAQWVSEAEVRCLAPAHTPGTVAVQVSVNSDDWTAPQPFLYYR
jgi:hypothetical protein